MSAFKGKMAVDGNADYLLELVKFNRHFLEVPALSVGQL